MRQPRLTTRDFVFIDAGTTTLRMAEYLEGSKATFVTTGIECARRLVEKRVAGVCGRRTAKAGDTGSGGCGSQRVD